MTPTRDERVEDYLDGFMSPREARAFEHELLDPEVAAALNEALALRTLLATMPPDDVPDGLVARIEAALGLPTAAAAAAPEHRRLPRLRAAFAGASWAFRGPAFLANAAGGDGFRTVGYASTPLTIGRTPAPPRPALWRRALGLAS